MQYCTTLIGLTSFTPYYNCLCFIFLQRSNGTVYAGRVCVCSFVNPFIRSSVRPCVDYVALDKRLNLQAPFLQTYACTFNVLDLPFQGQRLESNTLASAYMNSVECLLARQRRSGRTIPNSARGVRSLSELYISTRCVKRCSPIAWFLSGLQRIAFSPIVFVWVYPCVCVCVCVCMCAYVCMCVFVRLKASLMEHTIQFRHFPSSYWPLKRHPVTYLATL